MAPSANSSTFALDVGPPPALTADWASRLHRAGLELEMRVQEEQQLLDMALAWVEDGTSSASAAADPPTELPSALRTLAQQIARLGAGSRASAAAVRSVLDEIAAAKGEHAS